jgi:two-component system, LuxR family, response regulator FixJ
MNHEQTVFVIDDDPGARGSVAALVESMGARAAQFRSAEEFLASYDGSQSGCLVVDMRLRGMSGIELLETMSRRPFQPPALLVSAFADVPLTVRAMSLGAVTVLQKPYRDQELWDAIGNALTLSSHRRRDEAHVRKRQACMASLTPEEAQVLDLILAGKPNKGIARELGVGLRTVEGRRHSIMAKLGAHSLAELVHVAWETRMLAGRLATLERAAAVLGAESPPPPFTG